MRAPILVTCLLAMLAAFAQAQVDPANAFVTLVCENAADTRQLLTVELAMRDGRATAVWPVGGLDEGSATLKAAGGKLTGEIDVTLRTSDNKRVFYPLAIDATVTDGKLTGTYTDRHSGGDVKGAISGTVRSLDAPLGSRDFYPSPARPIGYRGDGNGNYPGATPVTTWADGAFVLDKRSKRPSITDDKATNIVWKTALPGWSNGSPLLVGDKVFVTADPWWLVCLDARTGQTLWQREANPFDLQGVPKDEADKRGQVLQMARAFSYLIRSAKIGHPELPESKLALDKLTAWMPILEGLDAELVPTLKASISDLDKGGKMPSRFDKAVTAKYKLPASFTDWENFTGFAYPTPCSDGTRVYATFGQGQTVCYDMDGTRVWGRWFAPNMQSLGVAHCPSPLLVKGVLVAVHGDRVRGLKAATGEPIWEQKLRVKPQGPGSYKVVHLTDGADQVDVVVTTYGLLLNAADGKVLADLKYSMAWEAGSMNVIGEGDTVLIQPKTTGGFGAVDDVAAVKLTWKAGKLETGEPRFIKGLDAAGRTPLLYKGLVYDAGVTSHGYGIGYGNALRVWDVAKAEEVAVGDTGRDGFVHGWACGIVAGDYAIFQASAGYRGDAFGRGAMPFAVYKLDGAAAPKLIGCPNPLATWRSVAKVPYFDTFIPEWTAPGKERFGHYSTPGLPDYFGYASPVAGGNRLFIRSLSHVYCIGDPTVAYDWNPASRP